MNLGVEKLLRDFFNKFYWRQHPEAALRYLSVVSEIRKLKLDESKILEVGSGSLGITPYLKRKIDGLDINFSGPSTGLVNKIKGSVESLPFARNSYDVVIAVDVLEHLEKEIREKAVFEMLRVAKKLIVIVVPVGEASQRQDQSLAKYWYKIFKGKNQFLEEHIAYGLPTADQILVFIDKSLRKLNKDGKTYSYPNLNLLIRKILMQTWITKNKYVYYLYLKGYLLLLPILRLCNFGTCYRRVFVIEFVNDIRN